MRLLSSLLVLSLFLVPLALAQLNAPVAHDDAEGDVRANGEDVALPDGDIVRAVAAREGDDVVVTVTTVEPMRGNSGLVFEAYYYEDDIFSNKISIILDDLNATEAEGRRLSNAQVAESFPAQVAREGDTLTLTWPASAIPGDARCFDFVATLLTPQPRGNAEDRAGWDITKASSCRSGSGGNGGSDAGGAGGSDETPGVALPLALAAVAAAAGVFARRR